MYLRFLLMSRRYSSADPKCWTPTFLYPNPSKYEFLGFRKCALIFAFQEPKSPEGVCERYVTPAGAEHWAAAGVAFKTSAASRSAVAKVAKKANLFMGLSPLIL